MIENFSELADVTHQLFEQYNAVTKQATDGNLDSAKLTEFVSSYTTYLTDLLETGHIAFMFEGIAKANMYRYTFPDSFATKNAYTHLNQELSTSNIEQATCNIGASKHQIPSLTNFYLSGMLSLQDYLTNLKQFVGNLIISHEEIIQNVIGLKPEDKNLEEYPLFTLYQLGGTLPSNSLSPKLGWDLENPAQLAKVSKPDVPNIIYLMSESN